MRRVALCAVVGLAVACSPYEWRHPIQWDSRDQILLSEASQVKVRAAQSRVFDTSDRRRALEAAVALLQDLGFQLEVLDEELGIVSGRKLVEFDEPDPGSAPSYALYDPGSLVVFSRSDRSWGPFLYRSNLVRLSLSVRARNESQIVVRASAQAALRPIEEAEPYEAFFRAYEQALRLAR